MGLLDKLGNLLSSKKKDFNLLIVGLDNSGKSSIINYLKSAETKMTTISPTVGFKVEKFINKSLNFTAFDMSGQSRYRNLWEHYYKDADAIVFVIDSSDRMRFVVAKEELDNMLEHVELKNKNIPFLFFANKTDIRGAANVSEIRTELGIEKIRNKKAHIFASNALNGDGIVEAFDWLAQEIRSQTN